MNKKDILIRAQFIQPGSPKYSFYSSNGSDSYINYIKNREPTNELGIKPGAYIGYIKNRHGASTFTTSEPNNSLSKVPYGTLIHDIVISYGDEYKYEKNVLTYKQTIPAMESTINSFLRMNNMEPSNYQWAAAHHASNGHPHIHIRLNEKEKQIIRQKTGELEFRKKGKFTEKSLLEWKQNLDSYFSRARFYLYEISKEKNKLRELITNQLTKEASANMNLLIKFNKITENTNTKRISWNSFNEKNKNQIRMLFKEWAGRNENIELSKKIIDNQLKNLKFGDTKKKIKNNEVESSIMNKFIQGLTSMEYKKKKINQQQLVPNSKFYKSIKRSKISEYKKHQQKFENLISQMTRGLEREGQSLERAILEAQKGRNYGR